ncbi:MAG: hypothetical protein AB1646_19540 [Thermodesulfobacteriota bacterium]
MNLPRVVLWLVALMCGTVGPALCSPGEIAGVITPQGDFEPKVRVTKQGSVIQVGKLDPNESFSSISLAFVFPSADRREAVDDLFIQWEKNPGSMGREWAVASHKGFRRGDRRLETPWEKSVSFRLIDKSGKRFLRDAPWQSLIRMFLDGKPLVSRPPTSVKQSSHKPESISPVSAARPVGTRVPEDGRPHETVQLTAGELSDLKVLSERIRSIEERLLRLENALAMTQKSVTAANESFEARSNRLYWGPILALILSVLFTTVSVYLTFTRLSRGTASRRISLPHHGVSGPASQQRFRRAV